MYIPLYPIFFVLLFSCAFINTTRDHPYITSAKGLEGWVGSEKLQFWLTFSTVFTLKYWVSGQWAKLYTPSTLYIDLILLHTQLIVCAKKC